MSTETTLSARAAPARSRGGHRSTLALVAALLAAFVIALIVQIETRRQAIVNLAIESQTAAAVVIAERVNTGLAQAWGAAAAAAEIAQRTGAIEANARNVAIAAARARSVRAAAVFSLSGELLATTDRAILPIAQAAQRASLNETTWAGAPRVTDAPSAPAIVRRVNGAAIVSVLDPAILMPQTPRAVRTLIVSDGGAILHASQAAQRMGLEAQRRFSEATAQEGVPARFYEDSSGSWAVGASRTTIGNLRVVVASPATGPLATLLAAISQFALLAAAPLAAVGALLLLLRQDQQRVRLAEAEAERAVAQYHVAAGSARAGVFEWRSDTDEFLLSGPAAAMLQTTEDTLPLQRFVALAALEDRPAIEEEIRRARRTGALDLRFRVGAGQHTAWIEVRGVAIEDRAAGGPMRFIGSVLDDTRRQEAQMRVTRLEKQLRAALESFTGPFALWDSGRRLMLWNAAYANAFKLGAEHLRPRTSYQAVAAAAKAQIQREKVHPVDPQIREIELVSGEWLQLVERRTSDNGLVTVGVDITPLKRQEEALKRNDKRLRELIARLERSEMQIKALMRETDDARQRAEEANHAKSAFLANMSHELRTPLTHIIGFSEIMAKELFGPIANDQYKQYSNDIYSSGNHLLDLINDILDMAKIDAGKMTLTPRPLEPVESIEHAVRMTRRKADEKNLQILVDADNLPEIEADHRAVKQMLINLLSNAIKFTEQGAIMIRGRETGDGIVLRVIDTGCGIPAEQLPRLARPFEQVETELSRHHAGTGLGLALTKALAEMHGGRLEIESELGKGTIVSIFLPRKFGGEALPAAAE